MNLIFRITGEPSGNYGSYSYDVDFNEKFTVKELVKYLTEGKSRDRGTVYINSNTFKNAVCEYRFGETEILKPELFNNHADDFVKSIKAFGSDCEINYRVFTLDEQLVCALEKIDALEADLAQSQDVIRGMSEIIDEKDKLLSAANKRIRVLESRKWYQLVFQRKVGGEHE